MSKMFEYLYNLYLSLKNYIIKKPSLPSYIIQVQDQKTGFWDKYFEIIPDNLYSDYDDEKKLTDTFIRNIFSAHFRGHFS